MKVKLLKGIRKKFYIYYKRKNQFFCAIILINLKSGEKTITYSVNEAMEVISKELWGNFCYRLFYVRKPKKDEEVL